MTASNKAVVSDLRLRVDSLLDGICVDTVGLIIKRLTEEVKGRRKEADLLEANLSLGKRNLEKERALVEILESDLFLLLEIERRL